MKWLITGGAGFIGSHFVKYALRKGVQVVNVDALTYAGHLENLRDVESYAQPQGVFRARVRPYEFVQADISDEEAMRDIFRRHTNINAIVNFAAESHVDRSVKAADVFLKSNILGTRVLLEMARESRARFLQISTDEVYGSLGDSGAFTESSPIEPSSPYSASKAAADLIVQAYVRTHGVDALITRSTNNFGPFQDPEKLIPKSIVKALRGERIPIYGDGKNVRDWLHVTDHCIAIDFALWYGKTGEVYNIGGNNESSNLETVAILLDELGIDPEQIEFVADRPGHDRRYAIDARKIRALGWRPQTVFEKELRNTARWYTENRAWWEAILAPSDGDETEQQAEPVDIPVAREPEHSSAPRDRKPVDDAKPADDPMPVAKQRDEPNDYLTFEEAADHLSHDGKPEFETDAPKPSRVKWFDGTSFKPYVATSNEFDEYDEEGESGGYGTPFHESDEVRETKGDPAISSSNWFWGGGMDEPDVTDDGDVEREDRNDSWETEEPDESREDAPYAQETLVFEPRDSEEPEEVDESWEAAEPDEPGYPEPYAHRTLVFGSTEFEEPDEVDELWDVGEIDELEEKNERYEPEALVFEPLPDDERDAMDADEGFVQTHGDDRILTGGIAPGEVRQVSESIVDAESVFASPGEMDLEVYLFDGAELIEEIKPIATDGESSFVQGNSDGVWYTESDADGDRESAGEVEVISESAIYDEAEADDDIEIIHAAASDDGSRMAHEMQNNDKWVATAPASNDDEPKI